MIYENKMHVWLETEARQTVSLFSELSLREMSGIIRNDFHPWATDVSESRNMFNEANWTITNDDGGLEPSAASPSWMFWRGGAEWSASFTTSPPGGEPASQHELTAAVRRIWDKCSQNRKQTITLQLFDFTEKVNLSHLTAAAAHIPSSKAFNHKTGRWTAECCHTEISSIKTFLCILMSINLSHTSLYKYSVSWCAMLSWSEILKGQQPFLMSAYIIKEEEGIKAQGSK